MEYSEKNNSYGISVGDGGAKISRRQFDKNFGLLKKQGYSGYEKKAKVRKVSQLSGFKAPASAPNYPRRLFETREAMFHFLETYKGDRQFRVLLAGAPIADRYKTDSSGIVHIYGDQLAAQNADDLLSDYFTSARYPDGVEGKLKNVVRWTLVAFREKL